MNFPSPRKSAKPNDACCTFLQDTPSTVDCAYHLLAENIPRRVEQAQRAPGCVFMVSLARKGEMSRRLDDVERRRQ